MLDPRYPDRWPALLPGTARVNQLDPEHLLASAFAARLLTQVNETASNGIPWRGFQLARCSQRRIPLARPGAPRARFPDARLGVLDSPWKLREAPDDEIRADMTRIESEAAPCDVIMAGIAWNTPDERVKRLIELCREVGESSLERK